VSNTCQKNLLEYHYPLERPSFFAVYKVKVYIVNF